MPAACSAVWFAGETPPGFSLTVHVPWTQTPPADAQVTSQMPELTSPPSERPPSRPKDPPPSSEPLPPPLLEG
jgi:hypothetical protein